MNKNFCLNHFLGKKRRYPPKVVPLKGCSFSTLGIGGEAQRKRLLSFMVITTAEHNYQVLFSDAGHSCKSQGEGDRA